MADHRSSQPKSFKRRGLMFVLSSPSGAGKSTIANRLLKEERNKLKMSVSYTTRSPRPGEVEGKDYHFVDKETFRGMAEDDQFLEWARVFDQRYGTPRDTVFKDLETGQDILFDIDWQGAQQLFQLAGGDVVRVFILPPGLKTLRQRLEDRATDTQDVIDRRMDRALAEVSHWDGYDYVLVNDDLDDCYDCVQTILTAERLKRSRQRGMIGFIRRLPEK